MNSNLFLQENSNILPLPARLPFKSVGFGPPSRLVSSTDLRLFPEPRPAIAENLHAYAIRHQQMNESVERLAFAALAGSGMAGILSVLI